MSQTKFASQWDGAWYSPSQFVCGWLASVLCFLSSVLLHERTARERWHDGLLLYSPDWLYCCLHRRHMFVPMMGLGIIAQERLTVDWGVLWQQSSSQVSPATPTCGTSWTRMFIHSGLRGWFCPCVHVNPAAPGNPSTQGPTDSHYFCILYQHQYFFGQHCACRFCCTDRCVHANYHRSTRGMSFTCILVPFVTSSYPDCTFLDCMQFACCRDLHL